MQSVADSLRASLGSCPLPFFVLHSLRSSTPRPPCPSQSQLSSPKRTLQELNTNGYTTRLRRDHVPPTRADDLHFRHSGKVHRSQIYSAPCIMGEVCSRDGEGEVGTGEGETEARERVLGEGARRSRSAGRVLGGRLACLGLSRVREAGVLGNATKHTSRLERHRRMHEHARRDQGCQRQASVSVQIR